MAKIRIKVQAPQTAFDGWLVWAYNQQAQGWERVSKFIGGGLVSFDSKEQAIKAAKKWASGPEYIAG